MKIIIADLEQDFKSTLVSVPHHNGVSGTLDCIAKKLGYSYFSEIEVVMSDINPSLQQERQNWGLGTWYTKRQVELDCSTYGLYYMYLELLLRALPRVSQNIQTFVECLLVFGFQPSKLEHYAYDIGTMFKSFLLLDISNSLESYLKFQVSSYCAAFLNQEKYAEMPDHKVFAREFFLPGYFKIFLKKKLFTTQKKKNLQFAFTMLKIGKGMAPLTFVSVRDELKDHHDLMTRVVTTDEATLHNLGCTVREFLDDFTQDEIGKISTEQPLMEFSPTVPSSAACFEFNRQKQGCMRAVCSEFKPSKDNKYCWQMGVLRRFDELTEKNLQESIRKEFEEWESGDYDPVVDFDPIYCGIHSFPVLDSKTIFDQILGQCIREYIVEHKSIPTTVVALREPFKVRVITKAAGKANYVGVPLQKFMHTTLRRNPIFLALDRPLLPEDFENVFWRKWANPNWMIVSGDYKGATNTINSDATKVALGTFMARMNLSNDVQDLLEKVVADQEIHYKGSLNDFKFRKARGEGGERKQVYSLSDVDSQYEPDLVHRYGNDPDSAVPEMCQQTNGQLMGSILSFPLLCVINAAIFRQSVELYTGEVTTMEECFTRYALRINGDDILFIGPQELIDIWYTEVNKCGLYLSLGKNYVHPSIFTINSQMFQLSDWTGNQSITESHITEIKYLNWSLVHPEYDPRFTITSFFRTCDAMQHKLLDGCMDPETRIRLNNLTLLNWRPLLKGLTSEVKLNWFVPRCLGGLGLESYDDFEVTVWQRRLATYMATRRSPVDYQMMKIIYSEKVIPPHLMYKLEQYRELADTVGYSFVQPNEIPREDKILPKILSLNPFGFEEFDPDKEEQRMVRRLLKKLNTWVTKGCGSLEPMSLNKLFTYEEPQLQLQPHDFELTVRETSYGKNEFRPSTFLSETYESQLDEYNKWETGKTDYTNLVYDNDYYGEKDCHYKLLSQKIWPVSHKQSSLPAQDALWSLVITPSEII